MNSDLKKAWAIVKDCWNHDEGPNEGTTWDEVYAAYALVDAHFKNLGEI
jgi:hypothetical protein